MTRIIIEVDGDSVKVLTETIETEIKVKTEKTDVETVSQYAKWFDDSCTGWTRDSEYNLMYLKTQEMYANDYLRVNGHLLLNEVYDMLGMPRTKAGMIVGWIYDEENPIGDNFVDFGLMDERNRDFINGYENTVLLDFNVNGEIISRL